MSYHVKVCAKCKTRNHPSIAYCAKCGADLPVMKQESDTPPVDPPAYAMPREQPAEETLISRQHIFDKPAAPTPCTIVDFDIPFFSMVNLLVKFTLAAIPAMIILFILGVLAIAILSAIGHNARI